MTASPSDKSFEGALRPYRYSIDWVSAEISLAEAEVFFGSIEDWIERGGGHVQIGSVGEMAAEDVVPDSPLAHALAAPPEQAKERVK